MELPYSNDTLRIWFNDSNNTTTASMPLGFTDKSMVIVSVYCVLFVVAAAGNLSVVTTLYRSKRHRRSRINLMICHLAIADLMVAFLMIPLEIGWRVTVQWRAGNLACKVFLFLRAFGLYLSSNVLVCVSLDRYFAVVHPLRLCVARRRGKIMLGTAWGVALCYSVPQSIIFHVSPHPTEPGFYQCVTFGFFQSQAQETFYNLFCVIAMYFIPLFVICVAYSRILYEITSRSKENKDGNGTNHRTGAPCLRRSDMTHIERARSRTMRLTITIVVVFIWCWTPYVVMTLWYMFDRESAEKLDESLQDGLFIMAVSNSCMNPLVYGSYAWRCRGKKNNQTAGNTAAVNRRSTDAAGVAVPNGCVADASGNVNRKGNSNITRTSAVTRTIANGTVRPRNQTHHHIEQLIPNGSTGDIQQLHSIITATARTSFHSDPNPMGTTDPADTCTNVMTGSMDLCTTSADKKYKMYSNFNNRSLIKVSIRERNGTKCFLSNEPDKSNVSDNGLN